MPAFRLDGVRSRGHHGAVPLVHRLRFEADLERLLPEPDVRRFGGFPELAALVRDPTAPLPDDPASLHAAALLLDRLAASDARALVPLVRAWTRLATSEAGARYVRALAGRAGQAPAAALVATRQRGVAVLVRLAAAADPARARQAIEALRVVARQEGLEAQAARAALDRESAAACARFDAAAEELTAEVPLERVVAVLSEAAAADRRLGGDPALRRRVVSAFQPIAWRSYGARRWPELRALLAPIAELVAGLESELKAAPDDLAFRATLAQVMVFQSEMALTLAEQVRRAEEALAMCPTLRNARVVLAAQLVARAESDRRTGRGDGRADLTRALELDPHHPRIKSMLGG